MPDIYESLPASVRERLRRERDENLPPETEQPRIQTAEPGYFARRSIPFVSQIENFHRAQVYSAARRRIDAGTPGYGDEDITAAYENNLRREHERTIPEAAGSMLAHAPALIAEYAAGGAAIRGLGASTRIGALSGEATTAIGRMGQVAASTPFVPSSYLPQVAQNNIEQGREAIDPRGFASGITVGAINNAILGSLGTVGNRVFPGASIGQIAARNLLARPAVGIGEQAAADVLAHFSGLQTGYGVGDDLIHGRYGDAVKHATVQAITFAAFGALHEVQHGPPQQQQFGQPPPNTRAVQERAERLAADLRMQNESGVPLHEALQRVAEHEQQEAQGPQPGIDQISGEQPRQQRPFEQVYNEPAIVAREAELRARGEISPGEIQNRQDGNRRPGFIANESSTPETTPVRPGPLSTPNELPGFMRPRPGETIAPPAVTPEPAKAEPVPAAEQRTKPLKELWEKNQAGEPVQREDIKKAAKWTDGQDEVIWRRIGGETLDAIGQDLDISREAVRQREAKALEKASAAGGEDVAGSIAKTIHAAERIANEQALREKSGLVKPEELSNTEGKTVSQKDHDPTKVRLEALEEKYRLLAEQNPDKKLTYAQEDQFKAEYEKTRKRSVVIDLTPKLAKNIEGALEAGNVSAAASLLRNMFKGISDKQIRETIDAVRKDKADADAKSAAGHGNAEDVPASREANQPPQSPEPAQTQAGSQAFPGVSPVDTGFGSKPVAASGQAEQPGEPIKAKIVGGGAKNRDRVRKGQFSWQPFVDWWKGSDHEFERLTGKTFPATNEKSPDSKMAMDRVLYSHVAESKRLPILAEKAMGNMPEAKKDLFFAVLEEERLRDRVQPHYEAKANQLRQETLTAEQAYRTELAASGPAAHTTVVAKQKWDDTAKEFQAANQAARNVTTLVGHANHPELPDQATYQRVLNSQEYKDTLGSGGRYEQYVGKELDKNYASTQHIQGVFQSPTQLPGRPFNFMPVDPTSGGVRRGSLSNVKQQSYPWAREAGGDAPDYNTKFNDNLEASLNRGGMAARKVEMNDTLQTEGMAVRGQPGQKGITSPIDGADTVEFKNVFKEHGKGAPPGSTSLYVHKQAAGEYRQLLQVDEPITHGALGIPARVLNAATLAAPTAEITYHGRNLFTSVFKPGMVEAILKDPWGVFGRDQSVKEKLLELAEGGVGSKENKNHGFLWGQLTDNPALQKTDPTHWTSKFLHYMADSVRLAGDKAFDSLAAKNPDIIDTVGNKTDFINQMTGQYEKAGQSKMIMWLRDLGLAPFATAGSKFWTGGIQTLAGHHGLQTKGGFGSATDLKLRASVYARIGTVLGAVAVYNMAKWGNVFGDDDTPMGAAKLGETADGKSIYFDFTGFTGLTRGTRATGLHALAEGVRHGQSAGRIADRAASEVIGSASHIAEGPLPAFAHTLATGENSLGRKITETPPPSGSKFLENLKAAGLGANPAVATLSGLGEGRFNQQTLGERATGLLGPFGPRFHGGEVVSELHQHLQDLTDSRTVAQRNGVDAVRDFNQSGREKQYRLLYRIGLRIAQIEHLVQGDQRGGRRWFGQPGQAQDEERVGRLRAEQTRLARFGLSSLRH